MHSIFGLRMASTTSLPQFQQVHSAGRVGPHHVELGAALFLLDGIGVLLVLVGGRLLVTARAPEIDGGLMDGLLDEGLGDQLLTPCRGRAPVRLQQPVARR